MLNEYPAGYVNRIKALDALLFLAGIIILATPAILHFYPGSIDTTVHITIGMLIAVPAIFRVLVAWGSAWLEVVMFVLGFFTFMLPRWMHMSYDPKYNTLHLAVGAAVMVITFISAIMTFAELRKHRPAAV
jgi:hypothetical protein